MNKKAYDIDSYEITLKGRKFTIKPGIIFIIVAIIFILWHRYWR